MPKTIINIIVNWTFFKDSGMSGGDRIFIELARQWSQKKDCQINIFTNEPGARMCKSYGLNNVKYFVSKAEKYDKYGTYIAGIARTIIGAKKLLSHHFPKNKQVIIYSSSDFWPDSIPALLAKLKNKQIKWVAGFFLFAPKIFSKDSPYKDKQPLRGIIYRLVQLPIYHLVKSFADTVFITSKPDIKRFPNQKTVVIRGGVDTKPAKKYFKFQKNPKKIYDALFIGRFHPQKGVLELIDIWKLVVKKDPKAKLVIIGNGQLEEKMRQKISRLKLDKNINIVGFLDGEEKYKIFRQSKIVLHPATYDSGGMAAAEAMAWGLPGVSFNLEALKTYYPKGMIKTKCFDFNAFVKNIFLLLKDKKTYKKVSQEAKNLIYEEWDWEKRSDLIYCSLVN
ncbi:MAG: glycosyltransferase [Candidatus Shapirobacteria bacterium]|nr:glycosyltransferase [Candidatus Shapirobacteria bacterium]